MKRDVTLEMTDEILHFSLENLKKQIHKANNTLYSQKIINKLSSPVHKGGVHGITMESANNLLLTAILFGIVTNTEHLISCHNSENFGAKIKLRELDIKKKTTRKTFMINVPTMINVPPQTLASTLDVLGYESTKNFKIYDIHYKNMVYYDYHDEHKLIEI